MLHLQRNIHWLALAVALIAFALLAGIAADNLAAPRSQSSLSEAPALHPGSRDDLIRVPLELPDQPFSPASAAPERVEAAAQDWRTVTVERGDTLAAIFQHNGLGPDQLYELVHASGHASALTHIYPGETFRIHVDEAGVLQELVYETDPTHTLRVSRGEDGLQAKVTEKVQDERLRRASGVITSSLFGAAQDAGLSDNITMKLASIFNYDIDFALDIREGDSFAVVYQEFYVEGRKIGEGEIVAAEFTSRGKTYRALRYTDAQNHSDYYTPEGKSLHKDFLRTPVAFTRISSGFTLARMHPILNRIRAHKGVDYAAPIGTPVKATSNGRITFIGRKGGYGNVVVLQHGKHYSTLYGHLSRFAHGMKNGTRVKQGQIIAYVGMTGLATGPHLHYEFRIDGVHHNPLTIKFLESDPIPRQRMADFTARSRPLLAQLDLLTRTAVALGE